jgi:RNA polymerase sigma factor (sigma-70 family)
VQHAHLRLLERPSNPEPRPSSRSIVPILSPQGAVPEDVDRQVAELARRAADDRDALNALYAAFLPRLDHWIRRATRSCYRPSADPALEPDDIVQQAFVVFADLVLAWRGRGSLSAYLIAYFPWRLSDAVRRMSDPREHRSLDSLPSALLVDGTIAADEAVALLEALAADLPDRQGKVLLLRVRDGRPWNDIAGHLGVDRRTVHRDWQQILRGLRTALN